VGIALPRVGHCNGSIESELNDIQLLSLLPIMILSEDSPSANITNFTIFYAITVLLL